MITENQLRQIIRSEEELLERAYANMTQASIDKKAEFSAMWGREADRIAARLSAFNLALSGQHNCPECDK